ncbi:MAG: hypothetical protein M1825_000116 [Sarcosagium campestre]|nr:MAG: hypothetical protein M1825_000116 [Sarcosagium campestre]
MSTVEQLEFQAQRAEERLTRALNRSQALETAIAVAEWYMQALKLAESDDKRRKFKRKCRTYLERAEQIKLAAAWPPPALNGSLSGGELPLNGNAHRVQLEDTTPRSSRILTTREKLILLKNSKLNGHVFPEWQSEPSPDEFMLRPGDEKFRDSAPLRLSQAQRDILEGWKRPDDAFASRIPPSSSGDTPLRATMISRGPIDLVQDVTTDCSVVASLCAGTARAEKGHKRAGPSIISSVVYPYDHDRSTPALSPNGKYVFRLNFNGCYRKVVVDDFLPVSRTSRSLYVVDRSSPNLLWPALLEKAYLKVRGGYDFPGSNSGTDIWAMSGWIPEQISDDTLPSQIWRRVHRFFADGDVLVTLGTGRMTHLEEKELGLVEEHDYAVLDMKEVGDRCILLVKNPWSEGTVWKGGLPSLDTSQPEAEVDALDRDGWTSDLANALPPQENLMAGTFWIDFCSVMQHFESIYLNWNPCLFRYRQDIHMSWDLSSGSGPPNSFSNSPQALVSCIKGGIVWLLLSRHFTSRGSGAIEDSDPSTEEDSISPDGRYKRSHASRTPSSTLSPSSPGFISLYVFDRDGHRVLLSDGALYRGPYVDSPQTLARLDVPPNARYTVIVSEQSLPPIQHAFTLSAFAYESISVELAPSRYAYRSSLDSAWTVSTAGGNASSPAYPQNPQFRLEAEGRTSVSLLLETRNAPDLSVHVKLVWSGGENGAAGSRVASVTSRDILAESGDYRRGCALTELPTLDPGAYTIICSTFDAGQLGAFTLTVASSAPCKLTPLAAECAGRLTCNLPRAVFPAHHAAIITRLMAPLFVSRMTRVRLVARSNHLTRKLHVDADDGDVYAAGKITESATSRRLQQQQQRTNIKMSVELGRRPNSRVLSVSGGGNFSDAPMGVRTPDVDLAPDMNRHGGGGVWLVLERLSGGVVSGYNDDDNEVDDVVNVEALADGGTVECGEWSLLEE